MATRIRNRRALGRAAALLGIAALSAVWSAACLADVIFKRFEFETPRNFGYFIGDTIRLRVHLQLSQPFRLDGSRLPKEGRYGLWLELAEPKVSEHQESDYRHYQIEFLYRIVNNPEALTAVFTPVIPLIVNGSAQTLTKDTPAWGFSLSPLAMSNEVATFGESGIRPDRLPDQVPMAWIQTALGLTLAGLFGLLACLVHRRWGLPGSSRRARPFARAHRDLRTLARQPASPELYAEALRRFHRAVNEVAGKAVFAADLETFFVRHPRYRPLRSPIESVFERSADLFFRDADGSAVGVEDLRSMLRLVRECRRAER